MGLNNVQRNINFVTNKKEAVFATISNKSGMITHTIRLAHFDMAKGTISLSFLEKIAAAIYKISERTLRLYVEGCSHQKRGKIPDWLRESLDFQLTGIKKGSTILTIEAPLLSDTLRIIQYPLFNELGTEDYSKDTALSLAMLAYEKAISEERATDLLDKSLLKELLGFKEILSKEKGQIELLCPALARKVFIDKISLDKIKSLEQSTPSPVKIKLSGKLDVMKHSHSQVEIITNQRRIKVNLPERFNINELKLHFGEEVTIIGIANYNPAFELVSILLSDIQPVVPSDQYFTKIPSLIKETTDIKQLIVKQKYIKPNKSEFLKLIDELNIDEPLEFLLDSIK